MLTCKVIDHGLAGYEQVWNEQKALFQHKIAGLDSADINTQHLIFTQHPHVYTLGKSAESNNLLVSREWLKGKGAEVFEIERGGDITYHGPGQLVVYPIFYLGAMGIGIKEYIKRLETAIINTLAYFGIEAGILNDKIGVWVDIGKPDERKIAAIGVKASRFVTMHGLALNVNTDLSMFNHIIPCGIPDKGVTSMQKEKGTLQNMENVQSILEKEILSIFDLKKEEK